MAPHPILCQGFRECRRYTEGGRGELTYISEKVTSLGRLEYIKPRWSSSSRAASNEFRTTRFCPSTDAWVIGPATKGQNIGADSLRYP